MQIQEHSSLRSLNTFGLDAVARYFARVHSPEEARELLMDSRWRDLPIRVLGGGSNILLTGDLDGLVLRNDLGGISIVSEGPDSIDIRAGAGVNWHSLVNFCVYRNFGGLENLSLIPGQVGAGPIQNIGAYGVELQEHFVELEALHLRDLTLVRFDREACRFGYRDSIFKQELRDQFLILSVRFRLDRHPVLRTGYGAIVQELESMGVGEPSVQTVSEAVIRIRSSKLPDPSQAGNAGSFFKNPVLSTEEFRQFQAEHPLVAGFPQQAGQVKVSAGWLIEQCGWKGYREGDAGVAPTQALVLVNYGKASGLQIAGLAERIRDSVLQRFGILMEREVNTW